MNQVKCKAGYGYGIKTDWSVLIQSYLSGWNKMIILKNGVIQKAFRLVDILITSQT